MEDQTQVPGRENVQMLCSGCEALWKTQTMFPVAGQRNPCSLEPQRSGNGGGPAWRVCSSKDKQRTHVDSSSPSHLCARARLPWDCGVLEVLRPEMRGLQIGQRLVDHVAPATLSQALGQLPDSAGIRRVGSRRTAQNPRWDIGPLKGIGLDQKATGLEK